MNSNLERGRLTGRVAIITGASRGIGSAIAQFFAAEGAAVAVAARSENEGDSRLPGTIHNVADVINSRGGHAIAVRCDVASAEDRVHLVERTSAAFGPIDILVNNAAAFGSSSLLEMSLRRFQLCFEVNVFAPFHLTQLVVPVMVEKGAGWVLNITSDASRRPPEIAGDRIRPGMGAAAYGGSKLALEHLTRATASEFAGHGIAVNALMPSKPIATPSMLAAVPDGLDEEVSVDSFAEAALQLSSCDPAVTNGGTFYSEDVLHPELGSRGWLAQSY